MPAKKGRGRPKKAVDTENGEMDKATKESNKKMKRNVEDEKEEPVAKKAKTDKADMQETKAPKQMMNKTDSDLSKIDFSCEKLNADGETSNLKICSWNVSGIRAVVKTFSSCSSCLRLVHTLLHALEEDKNTKIKRSIDLGISYDLKKNGFEYIRQEDADIVLLQEVKCNDASLPNEVKIPGYERYFLDSKKAGYCGMAFFSKVKPLKVVYGLHNSNFDDEGRIITAEFENFYVINVYVPNSGSKLKNLQKRLDWNIAFNAHVQKLDKKKPVIICGDMNVAHEEIDLKNPKTNTKNAGFSKEEREGMTEFLDGGFVDTFRHFYPEKTGAYTFWAYFNNARGKNIGWRLDYFIVSERIKHKICDNVIRDQVFGSDHCPIILYAHL